MVPMNKSFDNLLMRDLQVEALFQWKNEQKIFGLLDFFLPAINATVFTSFDCLLVERKSKQTLCSNYIQTFYSITEWFNTNSIRMQAFIYI